VRTAVITDFVRESEDAEVLVPLREELEGRFEREDIGRVLGDGVVQQALRVSWPGAMYTAWLGEPRRRV
jgi:hypothetical protein